MNTFSDPFCHPETIDCAALFFGVHVHHNNHRVVFAPFLRTNIPLPKRRKGAMTPMLVSPLAKEDEGRFFRWRFFLEFTMDGIVQRIIDKNPAIRREERAVGWLYENGASPGEKMAAETERLRR